MRPAGLYVFGVNGECMVRGVIGERSESRPRVPGVDHVIHYSNQMFDFFKAEMNEAIESTNRMWKHTGSQ